MADMYDTAVASMKMGVALPTPNPSFQHWNTKAAGTWSDPEGWTKGGTPTLSRDTTGFDGDFNSLLASKASVPDDTTTMATTDWLKWWHWDENVPANQRFWFVFAAGCSLTTPGGNARIKIKAHFADDDSGTNKNEYDVKNWTSTPGGGTTFEVYKVLVTASGIGTNNRFFRWHWYMRDAALALLHLDCMGGMMNPHLATAGYTEFTNVFPVNGPRWRPTAFTQFTRTPLGQNRRFDPSGGAKKRRLELEWRNESLEMYEKLTELWQLNLGMPGREPLPLAIEPNVPGLPPIMMVDFVTQEFPLVKQGTRAGRYGGTLILEEVW